jgi:hypothetical protein
MHRLRSQSGAQPERFMEHRFGPMYPARKTLKCLHMPCKLFIPSSSTQCAYFAHLLVIPVNIHLGRLRVGMQR